ncbi:MAG TPA: transcriptional regulator, partial [Bacteroidales bacterium]|nr:transcriptional regulator [Bacteroidales bacterium]
QKQTGASPGNLSIQLDKLNAAGYIEMEKTFRGKKPRTVCRITPRGLEAFRSYVEAIKGYLEV